MMWGLFARQSSRLCGGQCRGMLSQFSCGSRYLASSYRFGFPFPVSHLRRCPFRCYHPSEGPILEEDPISEEDSIAEPAVSRMDSSQVHVSSRDHDSLKEKILGKDFGRGDAFWGKFLAVIITSILLPLLFHLWRLRRMGEQEKRRLQSEILSLKDKIHDLHLELLNSVLRRLQELEEGPDPADRTVEKAAFVDFWVANVRELPVTTTRESFSKFLQSRLDESWSPWYAKFPLEDLGIDLLQTPYLNSIVLFRDREFALDVEIRTKALLGCLETLVLKVSNNIKIIDQELIGSIRPVVKAALKEADSWFFLVNWSKNLFQKSIRDFDGLQYLEVRPHFLRVATNMLKRPDPRNWNSVECVEQSHEEMKAAMIQRRRENPELYPLENLAKPDEAADPLVEYLRQFRQVAAEAEAEENANENLEDD